MKIKEIIIPMSIEEGIHKSESLSQVSEEQHKKQVEEERKQQRFEIQSSLQDIRQSVSGQMSTIISSSDQSSSTQQNTITTSPQQVSN